MKLKLVPNSQADFESAILDAIFNVVSGKFIFRNCVNCISFKNEGCKLANGQRPPAEIIAYGCDSHMHDKEIPF